MGKMPRQLLEEAQLKVWMMTELMSGRLNGKDVWAPTPNGTWHRCAVQTDVLMPRCNFTLKPTVEDATTYKPRGVTFCQRRECKQAHTSAMSGT